MQHLFYLRWRDVNQQVCNEVSVSWYFAEDLYFIEECVVMKKKDKMEQWNMEVSNPLYLPIKETKSQKLKWTETWNMLPHLL